ncbi:MAG: hypothetical protein EZS28_010217 [Streblomastix strix]|uniref:Uncharacterized protein n=1 Tax=Streblomastix strix TaxID=222440 RepID=A0A5J4WIY7_9EUKA|nr:MAG: hypothetical protein EZS28_010217 [Streblomastix strix]
MSTENSIVEDKSGPVFEDVDEITENEIQENVDILQGSDNIAQIEAMQKLSKLAISDLEQYNAIIDQHAFNKAYEIHVKSKKSDPLYSISGLFVAMDQLCDKASTFIEKQDDEVNEKLETENKDFKQANQKLEEQVQQLEVQQTTLVEEKKEINKEIQDLAKENEDLKEQLRQSDETFSDAQKELKLLRDDNEYLKKNQSNGTLRSTKSSLQDGSNRDKEKIEELEAKITELEERSRSQDIQIDRLTHESEDFQEKNDKLEDKVKDLQAENDKLRDSNQDLEDEVAELKDKTVESGNKPVTSNVQRVSTPAGLDSIAIIAQQRESTNLKNQIQAKNRELETAQQDLENKQNDLNTANDRIVDLEEQLKDKDREIENKQSQIDEKNEELEEKEKELEDKEEEIKEANERATELDEQVQALCEKHNEARPEVDRERSSQYKRKDIEKPKQKQNSIKSKKSKTQKPFKRSNENKSEFGDDDEQQEDGDDQQQENEGVKNLQRIIREKDKFIQQQKVQILDLIEELKKGTNTETSYEPVSQYFSLAKIEQKEQIKQLKEENKQLNDELTQEKKKQKQREDELKRLEKENSEFEQDLDDKDREINRLRQEIKNKDKDLIKEVKELGQTFRAKKESNENDSVTDEEKIRKLEEENNEYRKQVRSLQKTKDYKKDGKLEDENNDYRKIIQKLQKDNTYLDNKLRDYKQRLNEADQLKERGTVTPTQKRYVSQQYNKDGIYIHPELLQTPFIRLVLAAARFCDAKHRLQRKALELLGAEANLCARHDRALLAESGVFEDLATTLNRAHEDYTQEICCRAVDSILRDNEPGVQYALWVADGRNDYKTKDKRTGVQSGVRDRDRGEQSKLVDSLVRFITKKPNVNDLSRVHAAGLARLTVHGNDEQRDQIVRMGTISTFVRLLKHDDPALCADAVVALNNIILGGARMTISSDPHPYLGEFKKCNGVDDLFDLFLKTKEPTTKANISIALGRLHRTVKFNRRYQPIVDFLKQIVIECVPTASATQNRDRDFQLKSIPNPSNRDRDRLNPLDGLLGDEPTETQRQTEEEQSQSYSRRRSRQEETLPQDRFRQRSTSPAASFSQDRSKSARRSQATVTGAEAGPGKRSYSRGKHHSRSNSHSPSASNQQQPSRLVQRDQLIRDPQQIETQLARALRGREKQMVWNSLGTLGYLAYCAGVCGDII